MIKEPKIIFSTWKHWDMRDSTITKDPLFPIPQSFDISGIYLWAHFKNKRQKENNKKGQLHLNPRVIYIGKSKEITRRLEGNRHERVRSYKRLFRDRSLKYLYYSICYTNWTTWDFNKKKFSKALNACLLYFERKLIWEFAQTYKTIPRLNKE